MKKFNEWIIDDLNKKCGFMWLKAISFDTQFKKIKMINLKWILNLVYKFSEINHNYKNP